MEYQSLFVKEVQHPASYIHKINTLLITLYNILLYTTIHVKWQKQATTVMYIANKMYIKN